MDAYQRILNQTGLVARGLYRIASEEERIWFQGRVVGGGVLAETGEDAVSFVCAALRRIIDIPADKFRLIGRSVVVEDSYLREILTREEQTE
tara:strand:+ start:969 stop:1244 length:276 start_codon:yes stop_codon:yes gene_type:complete